MLQVTALTSFSSPLTRYNCTVTDPVFNDIDPLLGQRSPPSPNCLKHCSYWSPSLSVTINSFPISLNWTAFGPPHDSSRQSSTEREKSPHNAIFSRLLLYLSISHSVFPLLHLLCLSVVLPEFPQYKVFRRGRLNSPIIWFWSFLSASFAEWKWDHFLHCWYLKCPF